MDGYEIVEVFIGGVENYDRILGNDYDGEEFGKRNFLYYECDRKFFSEVVKVVIMWVSNDINLIINE